MPTTKEEVIVSSDISVVTSYSTNRTPLIDAAFNSSMGISFKIDAGASATSLVFKVQVQVDGAWADLYRDDGTGTFEIEEYEIPITPGGADQLRSIRLACDGIRDMRLDFKSVGDSATINKIHLFREAPRING